MAYTDTRRLRLNPASLGAAFLVNGAMLTALILSVPDVGEKIHFGVTKIFTVVPPPPPEQPVQRQREEEKQVATVPQQVVQRQQPQVSTNTGEAQTFKDFPTAMPPLGNGGGEQIVTPPFVPPVAPPVEIGAKINPRYAGDLQPAYPTDKQRMGEGGAVTVRVLVGADGRVKDVEPVRFSDESFLKATRAQALKKWRFLPATRDGVPIESWREMTVRFEMQV